MLATVWFHLPRGEWDVVDDVIEFFRERVAMAEELGRHLGEGYEVVVAHRDVQRAAT